MKKILFLSLAAMAMLCACTDGNKFKVSGNVEGAADTTNLYLEVANNGNWFILDSTTTSGGGSYSISYDAPEYPNIYRLRCADKSIYFTVDSIESITIDSKLKTFDKDFNIDGTEHVKQINKIEKEAIEYALDIAEKNDIILLAGKGHEAYILIEGEKIPFDEREIVLNHIRNK